MLFLCSLSEEGLQTVTHLQLYFSSFFFNVKVLFLFFKNSMYEYCVYICILPSPALPSLLCPPSDPTTSQIQGFSYCVCMRVCIHTIYLVYLVFPYGECVSGWLLGTGSPTMGAPFLSSHCWPVALPPRGGGASEISSIHISTATGRMFMWVLFR